MLADLSPEEKLCCLLCRPKLSESDIEQGCNLVAGGFDWSWFRRFASHHRLSGLIFRHISDHLSDVVPLPASRQMQIDAIIDARQSDILVEELIRILGQLESAGIKAAPYKGPVLIDRLWGDYRLRAYHDLDLIVEIEKRETAVAVLADRGYGPVAPLPFHAAEQKHPGAPIRLVRDHGLGFPLLIDMQFRPVPPWIGRPGAVKNLWKHVQPAVFQGERIWAMSDDWNLVLLGLHVLVHRFSMLHWVADFHAFRCACEESWAAAIERAAEIGAHRELRYARRICSMIMDDAEIDFNHASRPEIGLARRPFRSTSTQGAPVSLGFAIRRRLGAKIAYILEPQRTDREAARLPSWLQWPRSVVRIVRLGASHIWIPAARAVWRSLRHLPLLGAGGKRGLSNRPRD